MTSLDQIWEYIKWYLQQLKNHFSGQLQWNTGSALISNQRHWAALQAAMESINEVAQGIQENRSSDLLAIDIRQTLHELGAITGEVTTDDILGNIFANFCIGKQLNNFRYFIACIG